MPADPLEQPYRNFANAWHPAASAVQGESPLPEMQFKSLCKFLRQACLLDDELTQLDCTVEFRQRCGGVALDFEAFRSLVRDLAERQHAPLLGVQALKKTLSHNVIRWGMEPKLLSADELTCDVMVQNELNDSAGLVRALFERYTAAKGGGEGDVELGDHADEAEGRQIMAGNAGDVRPKMSVQGMLSLVTDFRLLPSYAREQDVSAAVREAVALGGAAKLSTETSASDGMYLIDFIDALVVLADRIFDAKPLDSMFRTTVDRVREMLGRIASQYERVCQSSIENVLPGQTVPAIATFPNIVQGVREFSDRVEHLSAIFEHHEEHPGIMGVAGLYKLVRECGLLDNVVTMARVQQIYTAATGVTPAEIKAAKSTGQALGMNEPQFRAALVYLAGYVYIQSSDPLARKTQLLLVNSILRKGGRGAPDPTLDVILEADAVDTLSRYSTELRRLYAHFAALYEGQNLVAKVATKLDAGRAAGQSQLMRHPWEVEDESDDSSLSLTEFNEFARQCGLFPDILSSADCKSVFTSALARGSDELTFPQFVEAIGRAALLRDEVIRTPSSLRIAELFHMMQLDSGERAGEADGDSEFGGGDDDDDQIDRTVPVDHEELRSHLYNVTQEMFAVADDNKSDAVRSESEKWNDLQDRNVVAIRSRPVRGAAAAAAAAAGGTAAFMGGKPPAAAAAASSSSQPNKLQGQSLPAAEPGVSKHISGPKMVAPAKKQSSQQKLDWSERGEQGKVMIEGTGKVSVQRPVSAPGARQAWTEESTGGARASTTHASAGAAQTGYRPAAMVMAGGAAAALGTRSAAMSRGRLGAAEPLCLIHEMIYSPECPYPEVAEEVEHGFAAHQFGDCETALLCYQDAYGMWVDACVEDTGCDVHPEVKVFLLNAIGMVHQTAGRPEDTLAAFLDAKTEGNNLDPDHPDVALSLSNIGAAYYRLGSIDVAMEFYDQAIAIREAVLGKRHVDTALLYNNKACCLSFRGDTTQTRALLYTAHEIFVDGLGPTHPRTFAALRNVTRASRLRLDVDRNVGRLPRRDLTSMGLPGSGKGGGSKSKKGKGKGKAKKGKGKGKGKKGKGKKKKR
jgi:hypothetical protein